MSSIHETPDTIEDERRHDFFIIDNEVPKLYAQHIGPQAMSIYMALVSFAGPTGCHPSHDSIGNRAGMSGRSVQKYLPLLTDKNENLHAAGLPPLVKITRRQREDGGDSSNRYTLLKVRKSSGTPTKASSDGGTKASSDEQYPFEQERSLKETRIPSWKKTPARASQIDPDFYPGSPRIDRWAEENGFTPDQWKRQVPVFIEHHTAKGSTMKDWTAAFQTWMRHAREWNRLGSPIATPNAPAIDREEVGRIFSIALRDDDKITVHGPGHIELVRWDGKKYRIKPEYHGVVWDSVTHYGSGGAREHREQVEEAKKRSEQ